MIFLSKNIFIYPKHSFGVIPKLSLFTAVNSFLFLLNVFIKSLTTKGSFTDNSLMSAFFILLNSNSTSVSS